jgi:hypothetical protein
LHGHQAVLTNDEGILLEPAQRILAGERPYTEFFAIMSPGSYWIQALAFRILGISMPAARLPVTLDFAAQCALIFWLIRRYASARAAAFAAAVLPLPDRRSGDADGAASPGIVAPSHCCPWRCA